MITILGPTASGKTHIAVEIARQIDAEIISADSRQVYKGLDIGTGKDLDEYGDVPYHLIDICAPTEVYNLYRFQQDFYKAYADITARGKRVILCGGTGLYIESILRNYQLQEVPENPELRARLEGRSMEELTKILQELLLAQGRDLHNSTDLDSPRRAIRAIEIAISNAQGTNKAEGLRLKAEEPFDARPLSPQPSALSLKSVYGIEVSREERRHRITRRLHQRLQTGMIEEVKRLIQEGVPTERLLALGLEYRFITLHLLGTLTLEEMTRQLEIAIHQFSKRQMTYFRGMERRGVSIQWIEPCRIHEIVK